MNELFDIPEQLSPRLAWIQKHDVRTHFSTACPESPWSAWLPANQPNPDGIPADPEACGYGMKQDDAIADLARKSNLRLWNEE